MDVLLDLVVLFGLAIVTVVIFRWFTFPSVIGFLVTGILAGPSALGLIRDTHQVEQLAEVGVILLLFTIGIEFSLKELARIKQLVIWGGGLQVGFTILAVTGIAVLLRMPVREAIFAGFLVALSSTAILLKLFVDAGEMDTPHGKTILGILIFQDLCIVPLMLLTPALAGTGSGMTGILLVCAKAAAVVVAAHFGARFLVPWILRQVVTTRSRDLFILTIIFIGFGTAWLTSLAGLSLALGAFIAGLAISESEYSQQALGDIMPFREAFMSLFFISVGMLLDPVILVRQLPLVLGLVAVIMLVKTLFAGGAVMVLGLPLRIAVVSGLALAQIGEFSFLLAQAGIKHGILSGPAYQLFLAASVATMALTPLCLKISVPVADRLDKIVPHRWSRGRGKLAGSERPLSLSDHVIIVGFGMNGRNLSRVLRNLKIRHAVIDTNPFTVSSERRKGTKIVFGDATRPEVLEHTCVEQARILVIAISDAAASRRVASLARLLNPAIHIIVRTRYLAEMEPLYKLGANEVIPEEFETAIEILTRVLRRFMIPHDEIEGYVAEVRKDSYDMFRSLSRRHSHAVGIAGFLAGAEIGTFRLKAGSKLDGTSLRDGLLRAQSGASILMIKRGEEVVPNPDPVWQLQEGDIVLLLGTPDQLVAAAKLF